MIALRLSDEEAALVLKALRVLHQGEDPLWLEGGLEKVVALVEKAIDSGGGEPDEEPEPEPTEEIMEVACRCCGHAFGDHGVKGAHRCFECSCFAFHEEP